MKSKIILLLVSVFLFTCSGEHENAGEALGLRLTSIDYEIISLALDTFFESRDPLSGDSINNKHDYYKLLITSDSTIKDPNPHFGYFDPLYEIIDSTGKPIRCGLKYKVDCTKITSFKVRTMTEQEKKETYGSWEKFYQVIHDAYGLIYIARPSYYDNKERSSIYIEFYKQALWAQGLHLLFKNENSKWIFLRKDQEWES